MFDKRKLFDGMPVTIRLFYCLTNNDCSTLAEAAARGRRAWAMSLNCGHLTVKELDQALEAKGIEWAAGEYRCGIWYAFKPAPASFGRAAIRPAADADLDFRGILKGSFDAPSG